MSLAAFLAWTAVGSALWTALLAWLGYYLGGHFKVIGEYLDPASNVVFGAIAVWYLWRVVRWNGASSPSVGRERRARG
jgi:membrane protein DedA with SNARE-associated domain